MIARYNKMDEERAFHIYIADSLYYHGQNMILTKRFSELDKKVAVDNRTGDEVANEVIKRLGLKTECI